MTANTTTTTPTAADAVRAAVAAAAAALGDTVRRPRLVNIQRKEQFWNVVGVEW